MDIKVPEPFPVLAPLRTVFIHYCPELLCMVHLFQVGKLMDDDVVNDRHRRHQELPVKAEIAFAGAATPAGLLPPYDKPIVTNAQSSAQFVCSLLYQLCSLHPIPLLQCYVQPVILPSEVYHQPVLLEFHIVSVLVVLPRQHLQVPAKVGNGIATFKFPPGTERLDFDIR